MGLFATCLIAAVPCHAGAARANLVQNGTFEATNASFTGAVNTEFGAGAYANLPDWSVTPLPGVNGVTPLDFWYKAATATTQSPLNTQSKTEEQLVPSFSGTAPGSSDLVALDPNPTVNGILSQTISELVVGKSYALSFYWAASQCVLGESSAYTVALSYDLGTSLLTNHAFGSTTPLVSNAGGVTSPWEEVTQTFAATSTSEILSFLAYDITNGDTPDALLDNVSLTEVPIPAPATPAGLAGLGVLAWACWRGRAPAAACAGCAASLREERLNFIERLQNYYLIR